MGKIHEYINKIVENGKQDDMNELSNMLADLICDLKEANYTMYEKYKDELYELAYGKVISEDMAKEWVANMKPIGEYWSIDEIKNAMLQLGYNFDKVQFYVVANMMMNDYNDLVKNDETLALKLAKDWLDDTDAVDNKLYEYYKHIAS